MATKLSPSTRVIRDPETVSREIDGRAVVIHLEDGRVRTLNPTGSVLWQALDGRSVDALLAYLVAAFPGEPPERLQEDLEAFLTELLDRGMARIEPA
ncbi:MAG: PqqD family protein [Myxococcales bacterium]|nr:PqqD family protein [Polyangiaceae bacterium]MDW8249997.1 PqqD family protein [Myxococcales bacterium]